LSFTLKKFIGVFVPLIIGIIIIYYQFSTLTSEQLSTIESCFKKANYFYVFLSLFIALFGYWSRSYRWKYALNHLGYKTNFYNDFLTVCVSYLVNLTIPRSGEVSRAVLLKKYENVPFDKGFGTIVAERIVDLLVFFLFFFLALALQFDTLYHFLISNISVPNLILLGITLVIGGILFVYLWMYSNISIIKIIKSKLSGLIEGMMSVIKMKDKWKYIFHSFFLWFVYLAMFFVSFYALPETENIPFDIIIMGFVFGSLAIGFTNGGLGAYPLAIAMVFSLFGIPKEISIAFGWLVWTSQTLLTILIGIIAYLLLPILNKK
jgi:glycosyltransferase 2 family protein